MDPHSSNPCVQGSAVFGRGLNKSPQEYTKSSSRREKCASPGRALLTQHEAMPAQALSPDSSALGLIPTLVGVRRGRGFLLECQGTDWDKLRCGWGIGGRVAQEEAVRHWHMTLAVL